MPELTLYFAALSLVSVGGIGTVVPEMQRIAVEVEGWTSAREFTQLFAISHVAPGPNVLLVSLVGWKAAGIGGALVALAAFCGPAGCLAWWVGSLWDRFRDAPWRATIQRALVPVTVGMMLAAGYVIATPAGLDWRNLLIAGGAAGGMYFTRVNPLWLLGGGGLAGLLLAG
jgi:chromate transporter